jgi:hypothetical protein
MEDAGYSSYIDLSEDDWDTLAEIWMDFEFDYEEDPWDYEEPDHYYNDEDADVL